MYELMLLIYASFGALVRAIYGIYKVYSNYQTVKLGWKRIVVEFIASIVFGLFGAIILNEIGFWKIGTNIIAILAGLFGANVIKILTKKFGLEKDMEINIVEKVPYPDLNTSQQRAAEYMKANGKITTGIYQKMNQVTRRIAQWDLGQMAQKGYVKRIGEGKRTCYKLVK
ncbi:MAG: hypothetical protein HZC29_09325 [Thaumarchaeota archaeon]|nr:hypothetical protein [Nitrososphaerota archaeon]